MEQEQFQKTKPFNGANIKIVKLVNGEEVVCHMLTGKQQLPTDSPLLRLDRPLQIKYVPQITPTGFRDYIALIRWASYTKDKIITIPKDKIMTITQADGDMANTYAKLANDYDNVSKPKKKQSRHQFAEMTDEEHRKLNEIFDEEERDSLFPFLKNRTLH